MEFKEPLQEKIYYDDIPKHLNILFNNIFRFNKPLRILDIKKNIECSITIKNIKDIYLKDDVFYITSKLYMIIIWSEIKKWKIIKHV